MKIYQINWKIIFISLVRFGVACFIPVDLRAGVVVKMEN